MNMADEMRRLVEDYRATCLWFMRPDYLPESREEMLRALEAIARNGDSQAFRRAEELRQWLLRPSSV
ncbi:MAG TPA: hypothetical protein PKE12_11775 [Kiritimatiellia bacterium]|nr:hypothetical protein [Kiritimatiellia bacterium]